jgi:hypothetical protein
MNLDHLTAAVASLGLAVDALRAEAEAHYAAGDNRRGNAACDGADRLSGDLDRLRVALTYLTAAR